MRTGNNRVLVIIALMAAIVMAGSAQAAVVVSGQVNATDGEGPPPNYVTLWLDEDPSDYVTDPVQDGSGLPNQLDYWYYSDLSPLLTRHGYSHGATNIPVTIVMNCSGTKRTINGVPGDPYSNKYRHDPVHVIVDFPPSGEVYEAPVMDVLELCAVEETFSKPLYAGWNLISLPLTPSDNSNSTSAVLSGASYDDVYRYNAESKKFVSVFDTTMDPGIGYFVNATADCIWEYTGTAYTSMDVSLKQGLNMVGWLNCSEEGVGDALSSIADDYYYVALWNTSSHRFEVYNKAAPEAFHEIATIDRGTGYFISAKNDDATLSESC